MKNILIFGMALLLPGCAIFYPSSAPASRYSNKGNQTVYIIQRIEPGQSTLIENDDSVTYIHNRADLEQYMGELHRAYRIKKLKANIDSLDIRLKNLKIQTGRVQ